MEEENFCPPKETVSRHGFFEILEHPVPYSGRFHERAQLIKHMNFVLGEYNRVQRFPGVDLHQRRW